MKPELLQEKIVIQKATITKDEMLNVKTEWTDFYTCRAYANGLSGNEYYEARKQNLQDTINFTIRYTKLLKALNTKEYRVLFRGNVYDITFVDNVQFKNERLKISCIAKNARSDL